MMYQQLQPLSQPLGVSSAYRPDMSVATRHVQMHTQSAESLVRIVKYFEDFT